MDIWNLPTKLHINGNDWEIRTDFRVILDILTAISDPDLDDEDRWLICLMILIVDFDNLPRADYEEACKQAKEFIDMGLGDNENDKRKKPRTMDWEQDAQLIIPAVNRVMGKEVRAEQYLHWWTFLSAYMEIGECNYTHILNIRNKKIKGKKLEKWEQEFIRENSDLVNLKKKLSAEEIEEKKLVEELFG